jgi:hypothetical protein
MGCVKHPASVQVCKAGWVTVAHPEGLHEVLAASTG